MIVTRAIRLQSILRPISAWCLAPLLAAWLACSSEPDTHGTSGGHTGGSAGVGGSSGSAGGAARDAGTDDGSTPTPADWVIGVDTSVSAGLVSPAWLGHYDLSGALYDYRSNSAVKQKMQAIGFREWRVGVGRWEVTTRLLPTLSDGSSCAAYTSALPPALQAPNGANDLALIADRDWFVDDGNPVSMADTAQDNRYALAYVRSVIDTANDFGATPFVDIDLMPRALARNRTFSRQASLAGLANPCLGTFSNAVSNSPPDDPAVFAAAVQGLVKRVVEGSGAEAGRIAPYWEIWNEFELGYAWSGTSDEYFQMALRALIALDAYRASSSRPEVKALHFGMGSFAQGTTATSVITALDNTPLPDGSYAPLDFISFHAYDNDPLALVEQIKAVAQTRDSSTHYKNTELVLAEWGPSLDSSPPAAAMDISLLVATVLARSPALGVTRTHRSLFVDFVPGLDVPFAPLKNDGTPKPLYYAYELLHGLVGEGGQRLAIEGSVDGSIENAAGAALVIVRDSGNVGALIVNRDAASRSARIDVRGSPMVASRVRVFDTPDQPPRDIAPTPVIQLPGRSIVLIEQ